MTTLKSIYVLSRGERRFRSDASKFPANLSFFRRDPGDSAVDARHRGYAQRISLGALTFDTNFVCERSFRERLNRIKTDDAHMLENGFMRIFIFDFYSCDRPRT